MSDEIWKRNEVESPCVKLCVVHPETRLCTGCYRSIDEIGAWSRMTPEERRSIIMKAIEDEFNATPDQLALIGHLEGLTQYLFELAKQ